MEFLQWLKPPQQPQDSYLRLLRALVLLAIEYVTAVMTATQGFGMRLAVLALATPVFVLHGIIAATDSLVRRDLRRWGAGWESSFVLAFYISDARPHCFRIVVVSKTFRNDMLKHKQPVKRLCLGSSAVRYMGDRSLVSRHYRSASPCLTRPPHLSTTVISRHV